MLDHHIQRAIVYRLAFSPQLRFSELKPGDIENKLFDYHLKKVVKAGLVAKDSSGLYALTSHGRKLGIHVVNNARALTDQAYSVLFLVIRRQSDGAWLLYRRKVHPLLGRVGFMHAVPNASEATLVTARSAVKQQTGIDCQFNALGSGYFRVFEGDDLESFTHYSLLVCETATGELKPNDEFADYFWESKPNFVAADMLPNMPQLSKLYEAGQPFFEESTLHIETS